MTASGTAVMMSGFGWVRTVKLTQISAKDVTFMQEVLLALCGGGVAVAVVEGVKETILWHRNRKAQKEDRAEDKEDRQIEVRLSKIERHQEEQDERMKAIEDALALQKETNKFMLYDRLRYLAKCYIADGEISLDDLTAWNDMHQCYHKNGGNGTMKTLSTAINALPVKKGS